MDITVTSKVATFLQFSGMGH